MIRQVYLYFQEEMIYSYFFAQAFDSDTINSILSKLKGYMTNPSESQVYSKPMSGYQVHYGSFNAVFFLFVTDMADRPKVIAKEIDRAAKLFHKNFTDPNSIKSDSSERQEFTTYIQETHYYLHPKLALMGPMNVGKSTIRQLLQESEKPERKIMNFAEYYRIKIGELSFDLWDFVEKDDFSPLWNNFIRGSDLIFFVLNATDLTDRKVEHYINLKRREGKYSNWAVILTHIDEHDAIIPDSVKEKYDALKDINLYSINLTAPDAKVMLINIFNDAIGLKKPLPSDFRSKLVLANKYVGGEIYEKAIPLLEELIEICQEYQEFQYLEVFEKKIIELKDKLKEKKIQEEIANKKIKAPEKIQFKSFSGAKTLPVKGLPKTKPLPGQTPVSKPLAEIPNPPEIVAQKEIKTEFYAKQGSSSLSSLDEEVLPKVSEADEMGGQVLGGLKSANPFFGGLKNPTHTPVSQTSLPSSTPSVSTSPSLSSLPKIQNLSQKEDTEQDLISQKQEITEDKPIKQPIKSIVAPLDMSQFNNRPETPKNAFAEQLMASSLSQMKPGMTREKELNFERSPLVWKDSSLKDSNSSPIKKISPIKENNPLSDFTLKNPKGDSPISEEAEKLGEEIRNLGESLSRTLCEKFISQLRIRLKKTNLTDEDLQNAARLYVRQRRKSAYTS